MGSSKLSEVIIGVIDYNPTDKQIKSRVFCCSLYVVEDIKAGEILTEKNVRSFRPGFGMHPKYYNDILGKFATMNIEKGTPLDWSLINDEK